MTFDPANQIKCVGASQRAGAGQSVNLFINKGHVPYQILFKNIKNVQQTLTENLYVNENKKEATDPLQHDETTRRLT